MKSLVLFLLLLSGGLQADHKHHHSQEVQEEEGNEALLDLSIYNLNSIWTDQNGNKSKLSKFLGQRLVLAMVYTSCTSACPIITENLKRIESALNEEEKENLRFVLVSFDSKRDNAKALEKYAKAKKLDLKRWTLISGNDSGIRELANVLGVKYKKIEGGDFSHSNVITVIDKKGVISFQKQGLGSDVSDTVKFLKK